MDDQRHSANRSGLEIVSVDNSAAGCLRDLSAGGFRAGRSAVKVRRILSSFRRFNCGRRANPVRKSTDGGMERTEATQDQARREEYARHEGKELVFEFYSLDALRAEWQRGK